jgi:putative salt-induced outer membrane protein YdiY
MKTFLLTSMLVGFCLLSQGAEALVTNEPPKNPWDASATLGATLTRGNSQTLLVSGQVMANKKWGKNEINLGADGVYGENEVELPASAGGGKTTQTSAETAHAFAQYNRLFTERLFGYFRLEGLYDGIAGIDYRIALSPGAGYYLIKQTNLTLRAELGPGYVFEKLKGTGENDYVTLRVAERGEWKINARAKIWESLEYLPQVDRFENYVVNAELGLDTAITAHFSQVTFMQDTYRGEPATGRLHNDFKLVAGVKYKF